MNLKRLRDPLAAALGALLIGGVSVAMANNHAAPAGPPTVNAEEPAGALDTDTLEEGDQTGPEDEAAEGTEADAADPDEQDPNYAGTATIAVNESTMPEDEAAEAAALASLATVSQVDAESAALAAVSGEIVQAELDSENGFVVWSIEVRDAAGTVQDVKIDAGNARCSAPRPTRMAPPSSVARWTPASSMGWPASPCPAQNAGEKARSPRACPGAGQDSHEYGCADSPGSTRSSRRSTSSSRPRISRSALRQLGVLALLDVRLSRGVLQRQPVAQRVAVASQQDERRCVRRLGRERKIEQNEWIRVEGRVEQVVHVDGDPDGDNHRLQHDEAPAA